MSNAAITVPKAANTSEAKVGSGEGVGRQAADCPKGKGKRSQAGGGRKARAQPMDIIDQVSNRSGASCL